jgi:AcrR family transcriptional regulator
MAGLRAKQKANRTERILAAATKLFRDQGYDAVRIEDISEHAEVSVGTFYNYFQTKGDILVAIVSLEVEEVLLAGAAVVAKPPGKVAEALQKLVEVYCDHSVVYLSKEMWRTAMALSILNPETPFSRRYSDLDGSLRDQVCGLIKALQAFGTARADVDAVAIGEALFNNLNMMFIEYVKSDMPLDDLKQAVARQNEPLARLISAPSFTAA